jgi:hypothetical protein
VLIAFPFDNPEDYKPDALEMVKSGENFKGE